MIEKRITTTLLESGELRLSDAEMRELALPEHSTELIFELEAQQFIAQWAGRGRYLHGEALAERLQDFGQLNGLVRVRRLDDVFRLQVLPPGTALGGGISRPTVGGPLVDRPLVRAQPKAKRRPAYERSFHSDTEYDWGRSTKPKVGFLVTARDGLIEQIKGGGFDPLTLVQLRVRGEELATLDDFEELLAIDVSSVDRMPHQEAVARQVLSKMRGRAVLADEVGLGKTIEAGLIMKELSLRGLAKRVLILCPAPLRDQWRDEMSQKFELSFDVAYTGPEVGTQDKLIMSVALARRQREALLRQQWDIVIVDEAHRVAGSGAVKTRELIGGLSTSGRYMLFLTATPVQNDLMELYRLVQLLRPGTFTSPSAFKRQFITANDPRRPRDPADLRRLVSSAMVRTTRAQAGVDRVTRHAQDVPIKLGRAEQELYILCTDLLRRVMTDRSDAMRRRSLALRLSASPFSMGTTALRMAERHPDQRVANTLREIAHHAMDIRNSARETKALDISTKWISEHGRVLVFSQHTDTVTALMRRYEEEGIRAVPFHGGMSAQQRGQSIAAFRSGKASVMVSTDAGAEGQNLQFCNCVLNYDLPWNPMRIEQRIGRVDRLTQPRDEVFIANLYARGTIDESVYRLLAEKLRMFELLFGQVTTILGELDESNNSVTFEGRVLEALFSDDDVRMGRLLDSLGTELVTARERAAELISADGDLSSWLRTATEHRKGLTKAGATELAPDLGERTRQRQADVQQWTREVLDAVGAEIMHDTGKRQGAFLTARFPDDYEEDLGGRTVVHLAFDRHGLEHHPDAELCAVGSPIFDELLGLLRQRGDLNVNVCVPPPALGPSQLPHSDEMELVHRTLVPAGEWCGRATFRATVGETEPTEHLVTVEVGEPDAAPTMARRELGDDEKLPKAFGTPRQVISAFESAAREQLETLRRDYTTELAQRREEELERIAEGYIAQRQEANYDERQRFDRALKTEHDRLTRPLDVRGRAQLLAIELEESEWFVEEEWRHIGGANGTLTYVWDGGGAPTVESDVSGEPITRLSLCSAAHWIDETELKACTSCDEYRCDACGPAAVFEDCALCFREACGACRKVTGGLCRQCFAPERDESNDTPTAIAWKWPNGDQLLVSVASCVHRDVDDDRVIVPDRDVDDDARIRVRAYANSLGLPPDAGLILTELPEPVADDPNELVLQTATTVEDDIVVREAAGADIDTRAVELIPVVNDIDVVSERGSRLNKLLRKLRAAVPPPQSGAVEVIKRPTTGEVVLRGLDVVGRVLSTNDRAEPEVIDERIVPIVLEEGSLTSATLGHARIDNIDVTIERCNESLIVHAVTGGRDRSWALVPEHTDIGAERQWHALLERINVPGAVVQTTERSARRPEPSDLPEPTECELVSRNVRLVFRIEALTDPRGTRHLLPSDLQGLELSGVAEASFERAPSSFARGVLGAFDRQPTHVLERGYEMTEEWQGFGRATRVVTYFGREVPLPVLDDVDRPSLDFGVCRTGHFYEPTHYLRCASCEEMVCRACEPEQEGPLASCSTCGSDTCFRCRIVAHNVPDIRCELCGAFACSDCGTTPDVAVCITCGRDACATCRTEAQCVACANLQPATEAEVADLPSELAAAGATVYLAHHEAGTVVALASGARREIALVRSAGVVDWASVDRDPIDDDRYQLALLIARRYGLAVRIWERSMLVEPDRLEAPHRSLKRVAMAHAVLLLDDGTRVVGELRQEVSSSKTVADLIGILGGRGPLPRRTSEMSKPLRSLFDAGVMPGPPTATIGWEAVGDEIILTAEGLLARSFEGTTSTDLQHAWTPEGDLPQWCQDDWDPSPVLRQSARADGVEAVLAGFGHGLMVGVRIAGESTWFPVRVAPSGQAATAIARLGDLDEADRIGASTKPADVMLSAVRNGALETSSVTPLVAPVKARLADSDEGYAEEIIRAWQPPVVLRQPTLGSLDLRVKRALEAAAPSAGPVAVRVGALVTQQYRLETGTLDEYSVSLEAGATDARRADAITGERVDVGSIDRSGHFVAEPFECPYCRQLSCTVCADGPSSCFCCGIELCVACGTQPDGTIACVACSQLHRATRSEAKEQGRRVSRRNLLVAKDDVHLVVFERTKSGWKRRPESSDGNQDTPLEAVDDAIASYLAARYDKQTES